MSLSCKKSMTHTPFSATTPEHLKASLRSYDLVLELLSDYQTESPEPIDKKVVLNIETSPIGTCPQREHLRTTFKPLNSYDDSPAEWINQSATPVNLLAISSKVDKAGGPKRWLSPFWIFGEDYVKQIEVAGESCGVRAQGDPNKRLAALIRIYRNDVYSLSFKVPSFKEFTRKREGSVNAKGDHIVSTNSSTKTFGRTTAEQSSSTTTNLRKGSEFNTTVVGGRDGSGYTKLEESAGRNAWEDYLAAKETYTEHGGNPFMSKDVSLTHSDSTQGKEELIFDVKPQEIQPNISLKRNTHEVNFTKAVNDIVNLQQRLVKAWNDIQNWVPKIGWSATVDLSILTGTISGSWGHRLAKESDPRFIAVDPFYDISFDLSILSYKLAVMFGVDFSIPALLDWFGDSKLLEIVLKAEGSISGDVKVSDTLQNFDKNVTALKGTSTVDISVHGRVSALGYYYDAKGGVEGGITFEGQFAASFDSPPTAEGEFFFIETCVYAKFVDGKRGRKTTMWKQTLFKRKTIWQGTLPA
jgi:hypothetical protein